MALSSSSFSLFCALSILLLALVSPFGAYGSTSVYLESELIILLHGYFDLQYQSEIVNSLPISYPWSIRPSKTPVSDFILVQVQNSTDAASKVVTSKHPLVKNAFPQRSHIFSSHERIFTRFPLETGLESVADSLNAQFLWDQGFDGRGVRVAVFDTGVAENPAQFPNVEERLDWTDEGTNEDLVGHGTFVAGVIAGHGECPGLAPGASLWAFRVFTASRLTYTSWFLDAFNYAIYKRIHILNLSIGGPDFQDEPFVDKVRELSANGIVVISAIGNEGPLYGTLNNPADQPDVIGVGGVDWANNLSRFSSRGMTTWEFPHGLGRVKPDVIALANHVRGPNLSGGCRLMSGTSVASPVVAGAATLLVGSFLASGKSSFLNSASIKQIFVESASKIEGSNIYEQGSGRIDLVEAFHVAHTFAPKFSAIPPSLDLTNCPYMWPYCKQPIFWSSMPLIFNVTILNSLAVRSRIVSPPSFQPTDGGEYLDVSFTFSPDIWPHSGWVGVHIRVSSAGSKLKTVARGIIVLRFNSNEVDSELEIPLSVQVVPTPPKSRRLLWDQFHNIRYPSAFVPRDSFTAKGERPFDWQADHPFTNFGAVFNAIVSAGYFLDILSVPYSCVDLSLYGVLLVVDPEDEFFEEEILRLHDFIAKSEISLVVIADWYNLELMGSLRFFDENTRQWWIPVTGGSNIPALNDLLHPYNIQLGSVSLEGAFFLGEKTAVFASGTSIVRFPAPGYIFRAPMHDETGKEGSNIRPVIMGLLQAGFMSENATGGRISVFGDSSCLDTAEATDCIWLLLDLLRWSTQSLLPSWAGSLEQLSSNYSDDVEFPQRLAGSQLFRHSRVVGKELLCPEDMALQVTAGGPRQVSKKMLGAGGIFKEDAFIRRIGSTAVASESWKSYALITIALLSLSAIWMLLGFIRGWLAQRSELG